MFFSGTSNRLGQFVKRSKTVLAWETQPSQGTLWGENKDSFCVPKCEFIEIRVSQVLNGRHPPERQNTGDGGLGAGGPVTCHLSPVTCHRSPVTCHLSVIPKRGEIYKYINVLCQLPYVKCHQ